MVPCDRGDVAWRPPRSRGRRRSGRRPFVSLPPPPLRVAPFACAVAQKSGQPRRHPVSW
ncbi:UNVERIFIED_CONTAM: hypothetical protein Slati_1171000 [Sesamum latifolium]|uniref:Uncharacterized protein n=1 Tax=Sesamum latifolium TaxID=2727402 RepID=A0AAW2XDS4_9LAMI